MRRITSLIVLIAFSLMLFGCASNYGTYGGQPSPAAAGTQGALIGGALGAALGAAIDTDDRGTGALIGGLLGAALGWVIGQYYATQVRSQSQLVSQDPQAQMYYQQAVHQQRPQLIDLNAQLDPSPVRPGSTVGLAADYKFVTPPGEQVPVSEERRIYDAQRNLLYKDVKNSVRDGGEYRTVQEFKVPAQAQEGKYYYQVAVDVAGQKKDSGQREFLLARVNGKLVVVAMK